MLLMLIRFSLWCCRKKLVLVCFFSFGVKVIGCVIGMILLMMMWLIWL